VDFSYDDTQQVIAQAVGDILDTAAPEAAWKALGQAGFLSLGMPLAQGGDGLGLVETGIVLTELGRRALLTPAFPALPLTVFAARHGLETAPDTFLTFTTQAGVTPYATEASWVLTAEDGHTAVAEVTSSEPVFSSSGLPEYLATLAHVTTLSADPYPYLLAGAAAFADGLLAGALTLTTEHLRTREQFGKPLATFQIATAHIADVYIASRTMHLAALSLAWGLDSGRDISTDVEAAAHWLDHEAVLALRTCHHLHGGIGLDVTYPLHRYYSLMKDLVRYVHRSH
jgi:alkylation response protein AidB-like acyl-CoA dehydrogenase